MSRLRTGTPKTTKSSGHRESLKCYMPDTRWRNFTVKIAQYLSTICLLSVGCVFVGNSNFFVRFVGFVIGIDGVHKGKAS
jgi:hypothetical protein